MKRCNIYIRLIKAIKDGYMNNPLAPNEQSDFDIHLASLNIPGLCDVLLGADVKIQFVPLLTSVKTIINWTDSEEKNASVASTGLKYQIDEHFRKTAYKRNFSLFDSVLTCFNSELLTASSYSDSLLSAIEKICLSVSRQSTLLGMIEREEKETFCLIYSPNNLTPGAITLDAHRLYNYAMLLYLNNQHTLEIDPDIKGRTPVVFNTTLTYSDTIEYEQYLDIYDVMNEWQHATDYLTSFLKMYQVMEFMAYRCLLSDLVDKNDIRHSFLRSVKNLDKDYSKNERDTLVKQLSSIFDDFSSCVTYVTNDVEDFVENHLAHDSDNPRRYLQNAHGANIPKFAKEILKFIYDVRCSIVHNKESELHFTYNSVDIYRKLIPLMKKIEETVGKKLLDTISDDNTPIKYPHPQLDLY